MQGFNMGRYCRPDTENPPKFNTTHPLGSRARKLPQGILTVRFELPFAVWCSTCNPPALIGQGVRFNAEKKKIGNFHSTPIWSFRIKHTACGGWIEIRTDPENTEYVVAEGGRRRDYGPGEKADLGELAFLTEEEKVRRREDAFAALEGKVDEKSKERKNKERVEELYEAQQKHWEDPYELNRNLRRDFRARKKEEQKSEQHKKNIQDRFSLGFSIADSTERDALLASTIDFGSYDRRADDVIQKPLFDMKSRPSKSAESILAKGTPKSVIRAEKTRRSLQQTVLHNTRAAIDPFLIDKVQKAPSTGIPGLKRKRATPKDESLYERREDEDATECKTRTAKLDPVVSPLVQYRTDSD
ncbi:DUF572-domain-containing protein [Delitschia confertaspora ATCC 74209]|uniref:DUF572-domain-containing protein n=1 Tax=Delitschia confertaspora ATCC 74209 TaxID=1513339 RepID=A0A9P4JGS5_9PLEO|nr:DUF572-domain-containing protein [Delitschia confertaspora ATCC 74209]